MTTQPDLRDLHHRHELGHWLNAHGLTGKGVEVGVLFGTYSAEILKTWKGHLHCVDPWVNQPRDVYFDGANLLDMQAVFAQVQQGIGRHERCTLHRMMSLNAVGRFEDGELGFVYLDGNHGLDAIRSDISAWFPKVRIGGLVCGHDFFTRYDKDTNSDALTAVMELAEAIGVRVHTTWDTSWWFIKTEEADIAFRYACMTKQLPRPVYTDNSKLDLVVVIPVAAFDWNLAVKMLTWWAKLLGGQPNHFTTVALCSPALTDEQRDALGDSNLPNLALVVAEDVKESGYFGTPNQMFKAGLEWVEAKAPGKAMLWVEADCVPMRPAWVEEIMAEYRACGRPFMGDVERGGGIPHLTGNAVYHPSWRTLAPALAALPGPVVEMGWDSQAAHDVLPRSHYAKTIQQTWRPPLPITAAWASTNIRPETALFHQCKDGSLIDVLCEQRGIAPIALGAALCKSTYDSDKAKFASIEMAGTVLAPPPYRTVVKRGATELPRKLGGCEILIVSCRRDIELLAYCLASIKKNATGFSGVTLVVPVADAKLFQKFGREVTLTTFDERADKGMLHHEILICRADELCPHADHVLHMDSDCMFWQPVTPAHYIADGRCQMVRERYEDIAPRNPNRLIWRTCVERATGITPEFECMVRHPQVYPRALYGHMRALVEQHTGRGFDDYVFSCENGFPQGFCEFDTLAAVGIRDMATKFNFVDYDWAKDIAETGIGTTSHQYLYRPGRDFLVETWSHAGLARYKADLDKWAAGVLPKYYLK